MKTREIPALQDMFVCVTRNERLMTVIDPFGHGYGYPFYRSTGKNSGHKDTWFPHRGIQTNSGWIMKPLVSPLPDNVKNYYRALKIDKELTLTRLGSLATMCISASIGTGFWLKKNGIKLKTFLLENYPEYFLDEAFVQAFLDAEKNHQFEKIKNRENVNARLYQLGSIVLLNCDTSRLPQLSETSFFKKDQPKHVISALTSMLVEGNVITEAGYHAIVSLSGTPYLEKLLSDYFFEDSEQVKALIDLLTKKDQLALAELNAINKLHADSLEDDEDYLDLLSQIETRSLIRYLNRKNELNKSALVLIKNILYRQELTLLYNDKIRRKLTELSKNHSLTSKQINIVNALSNKNLLDKYFHLMFHHHSYEVLKTLYLSSDMYETTLILLDYSYHKKLLNEKTVGLWDSRVTRDAMKLLCSNNVLNDQHLEVLLSLNLQGLIEPKSLYLINNKFYRSALLILNEHNLIKLSNLQLVFSLLKENLLTDNLHLLGDENMIKLLKRLKNEDELHEDAVSWLEKIGEENINKILVDGKNIVEVINQFILQWLAEEKINNRKKRASMSGHSLFSHSMPAGLKTDAPQVSRRNTI